jgi:hypothetical protein
MFQEWKLTKFQACLLVALIFIGVLAVGHELFAFGMWIKDQIWFWRMDMRRG